MTQRSDVQIGERFKPAGSTVFGYPSGEIFEVGDIRMEGCVVPHAHLFNISDPSEQKLISVHALRDVKFYIPVDLQSIEFHGRVAGSWEL
ncbi:MAG: hypothetical protein HN478_06925 [Rhodospirillaceae bacterium]|jgi:hypothetical protein|nr:hypothetical protein [Rhodospirillaceae bacterium]MBT4487864.1 hypothetical protein [Rhodospirillaceae bacterium]MBT5195269.1 hypothetical protein [Rhodospirillaceae bacterium]MBT5895149.1 hypothetical protein [Rhodospirillaceae bacterium]MBT6428565.1 hypothetical protein [Rhodospirillaceae bacterium]